MKKRLPHQSARGDESRFHSLFSLKGADDGASRRASASPALPDALRSLLRRHACSLLTRPLCPLGGLLLFPFNTLLGLYHSILAGMKRCVKWQKSPYFRSFTAEMIMIPRTGRIFHLVRFFTAHFPSVCYIIVSQSYWKRKPRSCRLIINF